MKLEQYRIISTSVPVLCVLSKLYGSTDLSIPSMSFFKELLENFRMHGREKGILESDINNAHYLFCVALDEVLSSHYNGFTFLSFYHHASKGGEQFFDKCYALIEKDMSEHLYLANCILNFGFKGKCALGKDGLHYLNQIKKRTASMTRKLFHNHLTNEDAPKGHQNALEYVWSRTWFHFNIICMLGLFLIYCSCNIWLNYQIDKFEKSIYVRSEKDRVR